MLLLISNLLLPLTIYIWCWWAGLEVGKPNNIPANTRWANGHSHGGHGGHSIRTPVACHSATETMQIYQRRKWVWSRWFAREAERIIVNYKMEQGAAVEWLLQVLAGCARREVLSWPVGKVPMPTEVLAILKETFGDQWGLSTLLTAFYSRRQGSCERVLDYIQGLVMLSTKVNEAKVGTVNDEMLHDHFIDGSHPRLCAVTFNNLWEIVMVLCSKRHVLKHVIGCRKTVRWRYRLSKLKQSRHQCVKSSGSCKHRQQCWQWRQRSCRPHYSNSLSQHSPQHESADHALKP